MIDFLDANQVNKFRLDAKNKGFDRIETEQYIRTRKQDQTKEQQVGLDIQKREVESLKLSKEMAGLLGGETTPAKIAPAGEVAKLADYDSATKMMDEVGGLLQEKEGLFGPIRGRVSTLSPWASNPRAADAQLKTAAQIVGRAMEGGVLRKEDELKYREMLPKLTDTPELARQKIENVKNQLQTQRSTRSKQMREVGYDVPEGYDEPGLGLETPYDEEGRNLQSPGLNIYGEIAKKGDLSYNERTGSYYTYGEEDTDKSTVFKTTKEGGEIDNSFISFLKDGGWLPIAGGIVGGIVGGPVGSVAGSMIGRGAKELVDEDEETMSEFAHAVLIEGATDALFSVALFGMGSVAKGGLKLIIGEGAEQAAKQLGGEVLEEATEAGIKRGLAGTVKESLILKEFKSTKSLRQAVRNSWGDTFESTMPKETIRLVDEAIESGAKNIDDVSVFLRESRGKDIEKLTELLKGKFSSKDEVLSGLKKIRKTAFEGDVPRIGKEGGIKKIDLAIKQIESTKGDLVSGNLLNRLKIDLGDVAFTARSEAKKGSGKLLAQAEVLLRKNIEKYDDLIAGTNKDIFLKKVVAEMGEESLDKSQIKLIGGLGDIAFGGISVFAGNPMPFLLKKGVDIFNNQFDAIQKVVLGRGMLKTALSTGNKKSVRGVLRFLTATGMSFGSTGTTESILKSKEESRPGLDIQPQQQEAIQQPGFLYR